MGDGRCRETLTRRDLQRLAAIAKRSRTELLRLNAGLGLLYGRRFLCSVLAGEAGDHFINGLTGFEGFEVWCFFARHPEAPFPAHRHSREDFGESRFGPDPALPETFVGRAVDVQGRSIDGAPGEDPLRLLTEYLRGKATPTARELAAQTLVMIEPEPLLGFHAWPALALR